MAKSTFVKLQEALAAGDLDKANALIKKMKEPKAPPKIKAKPKIILTGNTAHTVVVDDVIDYEDYVQPSTVSGNNNPSWMAPSKKEGPSPPPGQKLGKDGKTLIAARYQDIKGTIFTNTFKDSGRGGITGVALDIDKKNGRINADLDRRPVQTKIRIACKGCAKKFVVYPNDLQTTVDEDMRSEQFYRCSRCCKNGR